MKNTGKQLIGFGNETPPEKKVQTARLMFRFDGEDAFEFAPVFNNANVTIELPHPETQGGNKPKEIAFTAVSPTGRHFMLFLETLPD